MASTNTTPEIRVDIEFEGKRSISTKLNQRLKEVKESYPKKIMVDMDFSKMKSMQNLTKAISTLQDKAKSITFGSFNKEVDSALKKAQEINKIFANTGKAVFSNVNSSQDIKALNNAKKQAISEINAKIKELNALNKQNEKRAKDYEKEGLASVKASLRQEESLRKQQEKVLNTENKVGSDLATFQKQQQAKIASLREVGNVSDDVLNKMDIKLAGLNVNNFKKSMADIKNEINGLSSNSSKIETISKALAKFETQKTNLAKYEPTDGSLSSEMQKIQSEMYKLEDIKKKLARGEIVPSDSIKRQVDSVNRAISSMNTSLRETSVASESMGTSMRRSLGEMARMFGIFNVGYMAIRSVTNSLREGMEAVKAMDSVLTTLTITMDGFTEKSLVNMKTNIQDLATDLSSTSTYVSEVVQIIANASETIDTINNKATSATILGNLAGLTADQSVDAIQSVTRQFEDLGDGSAEASMKVVDSFTAISKSLGYDYAKGIQGMSESISTLGSFADLVGEDIDSTISFIASGSEKLRISMDEYSTAVRTVMSRMYRTKDGENNSEELLKTEEALKSIGISVYDQEGRMRNFTDVMSELNVLYEGLTDKNKMYIADALGGARQVSYVLSAIQNMDRTNELTDIGRASEGSGLEAQAKWAESLEAKFQSLTNASQIFWQTFINSETVSSLLTGLTAIVNGFTGLTEVFGSASLAVGALTVAFLAFTKAPVIGFVTNLTRSLIAMVTEAGFTTTGLNLVATALTSVGLKAVFAQLKVIALKVAISGGLALVLMALVTIVTKVVGAIGDFVDGIVNADEHLAEFNKESRQVVGDLEKVVSSSKSAQTEIKKLQSEIAKTTDLEKRAKLQEQLNTAQQEMGRLLPDTVTQLDASGNAIATNNKLIETYIRLKERELEIESLAWFEKNKNVQATTELAIAKAKENEAILLAQAQGKDYYYQQVRNTEQQIAQGYGEFSSIKIDIDADTLREANAEISDSIQVITDAIINYDNLSQEQQKLLGMNREDLVAQRDALLDVVDGADDVTSSFDNTANAIQETADAVSDLKGEMDDANSKAELLAKAIEEYSETGGISHDTQADMIDSGDSDLIGLLIQRADWMEYANGLYEDEISLRDQSREQLIALSLLEQQKAQLVEEGRIGYANMLDDMIRGGEGAYATDLNNFVNYLNGKANANDITINALANWLADLVGGNVDAYKDDLTNTKSWAEAKALILSELNDQIIKVRQQLNVASQEVTDVYNSGGDDLDVLKEEMDANRLAGQLKDLENLKNDIQTNFDFVGTGFVGGGSYIGTGSSGGSGSDSSSSTKEEKTQKEEIDRYYRLKEAITDVNNALDANQKAQEQANGKDKLRLMNEEIKLLKEQADLNKQLETQMSNRANELKRELTSLGATYDKYGNINNLEALIGWTARGDSQIASLQAIVDKVEEYTDLTQNEIPSVTSAWKDLESQIKDVRQAQADIAIEFESEVYDAIEHYAEKATEKKKEELEKQKKMLEDSWAEDDYQDQLHEAEKSLAEIDSAIANAVRSGDTELVKELRKQYAEQQKEINDMIQEQEREGILDKFEDAEESYDKELEDFLKPENINKVISEAMSQGFVNIMGETVELNDIMQNFLKDTTIGLVTTSEALKELADNMTGLKDLMNQMPSISGALGLPSVSYGKSMQGMENVGKSFTLNSPLVQVGSIDKDSLNDLVDIVEQKLNNFAMQINGKLAY